MTNVFFPEDEISTDDLYFVCYMIERTARQLKQPNKYVANMMGHDELAKKLSLADVLHSANPLAVASDWIEEYGMQPGNFDVTQVDAELCPEIPTATQMGKVYKRLILNTMQSNEDYADAIIRVYNNPICEVIDNYNTSAYYEPSPYIARSYYAGGFM
ncbi:MAG: hypothetical protein E7101_02185 [Prevotella ruminicola]|jgi:hypothetical protein|uniref:Uncharacterized protein n=1 Tax=Xylanibacter ruminicola TaxID=839 RepID=A0A9D5P2Q6_XYLRU|nr:hypothetical protein [Xylanibacter ruminicola]